MQAIRKFYIVQNLRFQSGWCIKSYLRPDKTIETQLDANGVGASEWIEQEGFDAQAVTAKSGADADVCDRPPGSGLVRVLGPIFRRKFCGTGDIDTMRGKDFV